MDYVELSIPVADAAQSEIVTAFLADFPFESFSEEKGVLKAYIPKDRLADCKTEVDECLNEQGISGATYVCIETVNWNALWESKFDPVEVDGRCVIRAPFHEARPDLPLEVVIMPKMSFGTGHHATTWLMTAELTDPARDWTGKRGLDMGSGTGVLAIVAVLRGAAHMDAIDIDEWADENCRENIAENGVADRITSLRGDATLLQGRQYDFVLANINRNILLADMPTYVGTLSDGGELIMSGILEGDIPSISERAKSLGMTVTETHLKEGWAVVCCRK